MTKQKKVIIIGSGLVDCQQELFSQKMDMMFRVEQNNQAEDACSVSRVEVLIRDRYALYW